MTHAIANAVSLIVLVVALAAIALTVDDRFEEIVRALRGRPMR